MTTWHRRKEPELVLLLEIMHCVRNLQIIQITDLISRSRVNPTRSVKRAKHVKPVKQTVVSLIANCKGFSLWPLIYKQERMSEDLYIS